ncbi:carnitine dehydratase [Mycobacterium colombiense]|uniref:Carnitine dehydratase n=2 Tax=Mycobacterium colombiense TaxID=339268 RepID=A0A1A2RLX4_9MYCO|nr:carnitine dehydratase [Mycobacterium colombiense]
MQGIRVLEVAQFTFVPAAGAILADWGADVIKVEHPLRGDTQRGFINMGGMQLNPDRHPLVEHPNRGKRSVGIDVTKPDGQEMLYEIAKTADVFLTNYLPAQRQKHKFDVEHIRAANPDIVYARGSAYGDKGPERDSGGFDGTAFWTRSGIGHACTPEQLGGALSQGIPAFGDSIGGMNIAGGIAAALFHRDRSGEAIEVDVSLLSTAWWAAGASVTQGMETGQTLRAPMPNSASRSVNPLMGNYETSDGGTINLCMVSPTGYIRDTFEHLGLRDAADDARFSDALSLIENADAAAELITDAIRSRPFEYWRQNLKTMKGQWAPFQSLLDLGSDEQALANDMVTEVESADGGAPFKIVRGPVQFNHEPLATTRAPQPSEHTELVLMELGVEWDKIEALKEAGAIA